MSSRVICKICGREFKSIYNHLRMKHDLSTEEYLSLYPGSQLITDESKKKHSESVSASRGYSKTDEFRAMRSKRTKELWKDSNYREKQSSIRSELGKRGQEVLKSDPNDSLRRSINKKKHWERDRDELLEYCSLGAKALWSNEESRAKWYESMKEHYNDPEYMDMITKNLDKGRKTSWSNPETREKMLNNLSRNSSGRNYEYDGISYRSSWEVKFAQYLTSINQDFEYESYKFNYKDSEGVLRTYTPDFYLTDIDCFVEIHPSPLMDDLMFRKLDVVPNIVLLTEVELSNFGII